jgi:hypothetical protein
LFETDFSARDAGKTPGNVAVSLTPNAVVLQSNRIYGQRRNVARIIAYDKFCGGGIDASNAATRCSRRSLRRLMVN